MSAYVPILVLGVLAAAFAVFSVVIGTVTGPKRWNRAKLQAYESGIEPTPQPPGGGRFPIKYYLTAMLFILFDIEIVFLYPWAVVFRQLRAFGLVEILVFAAVVFVSFMYLVSHGALDWGPAKRLRPAIGPRTTESTVTRVGPSPKSRTHEAA
jgi:NADH-quinone oxidoreductase subunit A